MSRAATPSWASPGWRRPGIKARERYAALNHPGDAYCYSIYATVAAALDDGPLADLVVDTRLAVVESQSAFALTTFVNVVHPRARVFDGFLIHSRGGVLRCRSASPAEG